MSRCDALAERRCSEVVSEKRERCPPRRSPQSPSPSRSSLCLPLSHLSERHARRRRPFWEPPNFVVNTTRPVDTPQSDLTYQFNILMLARRRPFLSRQLGLIRSRQRYSFFTSPFCTAAVIAVRIKEKD